MGDTLIIQPPRAWNANGRPSAGANASFYLSGTTTPATVYSDYAETIPHPWPLPAVSTGIFPAAYRSGVALKCVLTDANGAALPGSPIDPVPIVRELGASASEVTFAASVLLPYTDVQAAIDGGIGGIVGGTIPFSGPIMGPSGSAANPAFTYELDLDTGAFRPGSDEWAVSTGGTTRLTVRSTEIAPAVPMRAQLGSLSSVAYGFAGDPNNGIYSPGADQVSIVTAGVDRLSVSASGDVSFPAATTETRTINIGSGRTGDGYSILDFIGDATYSDYGLRILRDNAGQHGSSQIRHKGNGNLEITTEGLGDLVFKTGSVQRMVVDGAVGDIEISNSLLINESLIVVNNISAANLTGGQYTPTLTNVTNVASSTAATTQWFRVGDRITVFGVVTIDPTAAATDTVLRMSLPVASTFANPHHAGGAGASSTAGTYGEPLCILGNTTNNDAFFRLRPTVATSQIYYFTFSYLVA